MRQFSLVLERPYGSGEGSMLSLNMWIFCGKIPCLFFALRLKSWSVSTTSSCRSNGRWRELRKNADAKRNNARNLIWGELFISYQFDFFRRCVCIVCVCLCVCVCVCVCAHCIYAWMCVCVCQFVFFCFMRLITWLFICPHSVNLAHVSIKHLVNLHLYLA